MIAKESVSISPPSTSAFLHAEVGDSHLICFQCNSTVGSNDLFCQECGAALLDSHDLHDHEDAADQTPPSRIDKLLALRSFDYAVSVKRFAVLIAVVAVVGLSVFAVLAIAGSYDAMSEDYICDHAKKLLAENDSVQAAELLQRLYLARARNLKPQTLELLGQALVKRSDLYAGRNQIELAVNDLKSIPSDSAQTKIASQKLALLIPQAVPAANVEQATKPAANEPTPTVPVATKARAVLAPPLESKEQAKIKPSKPAFVADDVTNYNRLLAAYFEKTGADSEQSVDSAASDESAKIAKPVSEPPTLREWVNAGRPDF
jgi:hypothetical protein